MKIHREELNLKWFLCLILQRHKWVYTLAGGKANHRCRCDMNGDCSSIPVYDLTCQRCGLSVTLGEDEIIDSFAKRMD